MWAYYNEFDPKAAAWLRELIKMKIIANGYVDERSITDVRPEELAGFRQHHFFAGIGGWSYALRLAGWDDSRPVCTASLPCQPFSVAGAGKGKDDERHLLPHFIEIVKQCNFPVIFGEQVGAAIRQPKLRTEIENLQSLQNRQAYLRILSLWERECGENMQSLQQVLSGKETGQERNIVGRIQGMAAEKQGESISECGNQSGERARDGIGYNGGLGSRDNKQRIMRSNSDTFRFGNAEGLERTIIGQDRQHDWLSKNEYESSYLCLECNDEYVGGTEDTGSINWDNESAQTEISNAIGQISREFEASNQSSWTDDLQSAMEEEGYTFGITVLGAHSAGAPHIRQRLYWVADNIGNGSQGWLLGRSHSEREAIYGQAGHNGSVDDIGRMGNTKNIRPSDGEIDSPTNPSDSLNVESSGVQTWINPDWLYCRDNKYRPIKPGIKPLVDGVPHGVVHSSDPDNTQEARVMRLKGYGNAIVPQVAAQFIKAFMAV